MNGILEKVVADLKQQRAELDDAIQYFERNNGNGAKRGRKKWTPEQHRKFRASMAARRKK